MTSGGESAPRCATKSVGCAARPSRPPPAPPAALPPLRRWSDALSVGADASICRPVLYRWRTRTTETTAAIASVATVDAENGALTFALAHFAPYSSINAITRSRSRSRSRSASPGRRRKRCA